LNIGVRVESEEIAAQYGVQGDITCRN